MHRRLSLAAVALAAVLFALPASAIEATGYVMDEANIIPAAVQARIEAASAQLEADTPGAQIAVATVPSLDGNEIEEYAEELFDELGVGSDEEDNGVLLLVAIEEREVRIEVGYGLEGAIPDSTAGRLLDDYVLPRFREGDMAGGIEAGHARLVELVRAEYSGEPVDDGASSVAGSGFPVLLVALGILGLVIAAFVWAVKKGYMKGGSGGSGGSSGGSGGYSPPPSSFGGGSSSSSSSDFGGGGGFGGFGGGGSGGGGASRGW